MTRSQLIILGKHTRDMSDARVVLEQRGSPLKLFLSLPGTLDSVYSIHYGFPLCLVTIWWLSSRDVAGRIREFSYICLQLGVWLQVPDLNHGQEERHTHD